MGAVDLTGLLMLPKPKQGRGEILTDGAGWDMVTGRVNWIGAKQAMPPETPPGTVIAPLGWIPSTLKFIELANERCVDFDAVRDQALPMWREVEAAIPSEERARFASAGVDIGVALAGWSNRHQRPEVFAIDPKADNPMWEFEALLIAPGDAVVLDDIATKLAADPEGFDPETDGVDLMETLRTFPKKFGEGSFSAIGAFVQATTITAAGVYSRIVHRWPDRIGQPIHLPTRLRSAATRAPNLSAAPPAIQ